MLIQLLVTLVAGGMFAGALAVSRAAFRRFLHGRSARPRLDVAAPLRWRSLIALLHKTQQLVQGCRWEGCGGLRLTEDMRVVIAAHACLLVLGHPGDPHPELDEILVYPGTFQPRRFSWTPPPTPTMSRRRWASRGSTEWSSNVLIHEFAHQLDTTAGPADGTPRLPDATALSSWTAMLEREFERLCREAESSTQGVLDHYGATDQAEFFAVATEAFFEHNALRRYYRQDPAAPAGTEA